MRRIDWWGVLGLLCMIGSALLTIAIVLAIVEVYRHGL